MECFNKLIIGGKFDDKGGSKAIKLTDLVSPIPNCTFLNGGEKKTLKLFLNTDLPKFDIVCVFSSFDDKVKFYNRIRRINPNIIVIDNVNGNIENLRMYMLENNINYLMNTTRVENGFSIKLYDKDGEILKETSNPNEILNNTFQIISDDISAKEQKKIDELKRQSILNQIELDKESNGLFPMERLHLRITGDNISVLYRPIHSYIAFLSNDDNGLQEIKRLSEMSKESFKEYLVSKGVKVSKNAIEKATASGRDSLEEWYQRSWSKTTETLFEKINTINPVELPTLTVR